MNKYRKTEIANKVEIELKQAQTVKAELEEMNYEKDDGDVFNMIQVPSFSCPDGCLKQVACLQ